MTKDKKDFFYVIVLILTIITMIVGVTFAVYSLVKTQEDSNSSVYTGTLQIEYLKGRVVKLESLFPREKPTLKDKDNIYRNDFEVKNTGSLDANLTIVLEIKDNVFSSDIVGYSIYNENEEIKSGQIDGDEGDFILVENLRLKNNETENYTLVMWLVENYKNQNNEMLRYLTGSIRIDATQVKNEEVK